MNKKNLDAILALHALWLSSNSNGRRADLRSADLSGANLRSADLRSADLRSANLRSADLSGANLRSADLSGADLRSADLRSANLRSADLSGADLRSADLSGANLRSADLRSADLRSANLRSADLSGANLRSADLRSADLSGANLPHFQLPPEEGDFIAYKAVNGGILTLKIPAKAKRTSSLIGRKCRAEYVQVIKAESLDGKKIKGKFTGMHDKSVIYSIGKTIKPNKYDPDIRIECTFGIHFFMTKKEAKEYL